MSLSRREQRQLGRIERDLLTDPALVAVSVLMGSARPPRSRVPELLRRFRPLVVALIITLSAVGALIAAMVGGAPSPVLAGVVLVPLYPLLAVWGHRRSRRRPRPQSNKSYVAG